MTLSSDGRPGALVVGRLSVFPPVIQAPMSAITTLAMRTLAEEQGCGLTITEWLPAVSLASRGDAVRRLTPSVGGRPFGVQIFGRDPAAMGRAALLAARSGAALVDINMGCPGKKARSGSCGAALMREPTLASRLVDAVRGAVQDREVVVSVKMRAGWDRQSVNAPLFAKQMVAAGAELVTVHGRTRMQRYAGQVDLDLIAAVKAAVDVPVVANGDIVGVASMAETFSRTGADGVMVGRAAIGNPWIFKRLRAWWSGETVAPPPLAERAAMYLRHLSLYRQAGEGQRAVLEMRKFVGLYLGQDPDGDRLARQVKRMLDADEISRFLEPWLGDRDAAVPSS